MKNILDVSFKVKLVGFAIFVALFSLGSTFTFVVIRDAQAFQKDLEERTTLMARVVGDYSASDIVFSDQKASQESLSLLRSVPDVVYAAVYDSKGALFSSYEKSGSAVPLRPQLEIGAEIKNGVLHVVEPIPIPGELNGWICLGVSTEALDSRVRTHLRMTLAVVLTILAIAILMALGLQRIISRPMLELVAATRQISRSPDYSVRVKKSGGGEIGLLCDTFNEMLQEIERREEARARADRRTQEKSLFLAHMSHELRTPLNSIIGFSDVLQDAIADRLTPRERKFLANINTSGRHLLRVINNILDLSKIEAGKMELELSVFPLKETIEDVVAAMKGITDPRGVLVDVDVPDGLPVMRADDVRIKQILYNLLSNAVKFSPAESRVLIRARHAEGVFEIRVKDEGIGMSEDDQKIIFQEFHQLDASESRQFEGTGLGLALVKRFVELHGGQIRVESWPGKGSTFTFTIPDRPAKGAKGP